ncbi:MAG: choice-of-anchor B family protein [Candidatus Krumholzibacteriia bacterium]
MSSAHDRWWAPARPGLVALASLCIVGGAQAQDHLNVEILSNFNPQGGVSGTAYMDIWGYNAPNGTELAILCSFDATIFVDVTDPTRPQTVLHAFGWIATHRDARTYENYAYVVNDNGGGGMEIFDLSNPRQPVFVRAYDATFDTAHNIGIYDGYAYIAGSRKNSIDAGMRILDLSDPENPRDVGAYTDLYVHDVYVRDDVAYLSNIFNSGLTILDVGDKSSPQEVAFVVTGANTHNAWLTEDGRHLLTTHEVVGGHIRIWDVTDSRNVFRVARWDAGTIATVHNVFVKGDSAYASYYAQGLQVVDITDRSAPRRAAFYDTRPGTISGLTGVWGVYPFAQSGNIFISDMAQGLYVARLTDTSPETSSFVLTAPESQTASPGQTQLLFFYEVLNAGPRAELLELSATNSESWPMSWPPSVRVPPTGAELVAVSVDVPGELSQDVAVDVELCATSTSSGLQRCASTDPSVPVVLQELTAAYDAGHGVELSWRLQAHPGETASLSVLRATAGSAWQERAQLAATATRFRDPDVESGRTYLYALALHVPDGFEILGRRAVHVEAPGVSRLLGNRPNPFNPRTRIRFELARPGRARIRVFDGHGRLVRELRSSVLPAGTHGLRWDGRDHAGRPQPSGTYFYELLASGWRGSGRMTLLR